MTRTIKKALSVVLSVVMLTVAVPFGSTVAADTDSMAYEVTAVNGVAVTSNTAIKAGDNVTVVLKLTNYQTIYSWNTGIEFNTDVLTLSSCTFADFWNRAECLNFSEAQDGYHQIGAVSNIGLAPVDDADRIKNNPSTVVATLVFEVSANAPSGSYALSASQVSETYVSVIENGTGTTVNIPVTGCSINISVNKSALKSALDTAKARDLSAYTSDSVAAYNSAVAEGQRVYDNAAATDTEVAKAVETVNNAVNLLVAKASAVEKEMLLRAIQSAQKIIDNVQPGYYTDESMDAARTEIAKAQAVYNNADATSADVIKAYDYVDTDNINAILVVSTFTVVFKDAEGRTISTQTVSFGESATPPATTPTKPSDNTYNYTFTNWDVSFDSVKRDLVVNPVFSATYVNYAIEFVNYDGVSISGPTNYHYGDTVVVPADPERASDSTYNYTFAGWTPAVDKVTKSVTYTATYNSSFIDYTVTFENYDGTVISQNTYHYGDTVTLPADPTRPSDSTYSYTFSGWSPDVSPVNGNVTYTAQFSRSKVKYTVEFVNYDGSVISSGEYEYGAVVSVPANPSRPADKTYTYTFKGWDKAVVSVTSDAKYTAQYNAEFVNYTVTFYDEDGKTVLSQKTDYHYGDTVNEPKTPTKPADESHTYTFAGWTPTVTDVTGDASYVATYTTGAVLYTVTFINEDGTLISSKQYNYGDTVEQPVAPEKATDKTYTYEFAGWDNTVTTVKGNATYTATYTATYIDYTVKFADENGDILSEKTYHYGDTVKQPETPAKAADNTYTYEFAGWDKTVTAVEGDVTYTATYTSTYIDYTVKFVNENGDVLSEKTYHYGDTAEQPATPTKAADNTYTYQFAGWDKAVTAVDGDVTYTATYDKTFIEYTVTFKNYDDSVLSEKTYHYGDTVTVPSNPEKPTDDTYYYEFAGWSPEVTTVSGNVVYVATYDKFFNTANYSEVNALVEQANALVQGDYTSVSFARVTNAVNAVVYDLKLNEQSRVDAMADDIQTAIDKLVSTKEYDKMLETCLAVNNDNNAYTADSFAQFKSAMAGIDTAKNFNTESATQADVDSALNALNDAYALLKASYVAISGVEKYELDNTAIVLGSNVKLSASKLVADDGGAGLASLRYIDKNGNEMASSKVIGTGCKVQLIYNGEVSQEYTIIVYGDITGDGQVTVADIMKAKAMSASTQNFTQAQIAAASCGTGAVSVDAVTELAKRV